MELITGILLTSLAVVFTVYYFSSKNRKLRKIPGPSGYPVIGNVLQFDWKKPQETLRKWAMQYGDVMKINLFGQDIVVANSHAAIYEVMVKKSNDFAGRPQSYVKEVLFHGGEDIGLSDMSPKWSYLKKTSMTGLKQVGDHVTALDDILQEYLEDILKKLAKSDEKTIDLRNIINRFVYLVTFTLIHGKEINQEDFEKYLNVNNRFIDVIDPLSKYASLEAMPFLRGPWSGIYRKFKKYLDDMQSLYSEHTATTVKDHKEDEINCVLDSLIQEMKKPTLDKDKVAPITFDDIVGINFDLVNGGVLTTSTVMYYFLSLMATNPDIQEEARDHIIQVIGERPPTLNDRFSIPYVESMMLEVLRFMTQTPVGVPHKTLTDTNLQGYEIPMGTPIWTNLWFLHHDERLWEDPWEFKPKRFLDKDGNLVKADHPLRKQFLSFGAGRRVCVGESLAKHRIFLFMVSMLQNFRFSQPKNETIDADPKKLQFAAILQMASYNIHVSVRK